MPEGLNPASMYGEQGWIPAITDCVATTVSISDWIPAFAGMTTFESLACQKTGKEIYYNKQGPICG